MSAGLRVLSLGAGVQSTTLLLLAAEGRLPRLDAAIFADTEWEPVAVYEHLDRLEREVAQPAGIPVLRVRAGTGTGRVTGNLRADSLNPGAFVRLPVFVADRSGEGTAMVRRQCTEEYKVKPIKAAVRALLGYPHPRPVPRGLAAEQWIGISRDEFHRAKDAAVGYLRNAFPLLDLDGAADGRRGWTRNDCIRYLRASGWADTPKSACVGCPFHGNRQWRALRDTCACGHHRERHRGPVCDHADQHRGGDRCPCPGFHAPEWDDAVAFDHALRTQRLRGIKEAPYLHRSRQPLDRAPIDKVTRREWTDRQTDLFDSHADDAENGAPDGCSPWACRGDHTTGGDSA